MNANGIFCGQGDPVKDMRHFVISRDGFTRLINQNCVHLHVEMGIFNQPGQKPPFLQKRQNMCKIILLSYQNTVKNADGPIKNRQSSAVLCTLKALAAAEAALI